MKALQGFVRIAVKPFVTVFNLDKTVGQDMKKAGAPGLRKVANNFDNLDYVNEQPTGSTMYTTAEPWPKVCSHPRFCTGMFDLC